MESFSVVERLLLLSILPAQGDIVTLRVVKELRDALSLDEAEIKKVEIKNTPEGVTWNKDVECSKDIELSDSQRGTICDTLKKLNGEKKLNLQTAALYERFVK